MNAVWMPRASGKRVSVKACFDVAPRPQIGAENWRSRACGMCAPPLACLFDRERSKKWRPVNLQ